MVCCGSCVDDGREAKGLTLGDEKGDVMNQVMDGSRPRPPRGFTLWTCGVVGLSVLLFLTACTSTVTAKRGGDEGIPYYLPKPYLLVAKNISLLQSKTTTTVTQVKEDKKETVTTVTTAEPVSPGVKEGADSLSFQIIYLPDLMQKHGVHIQTGTGTLETTITLVDGWKLTGVNLKSDAKTAETIQAIGSLLESVSSAFGIPTKMKAVAEDTVAGLWLYEILVEDNRLKFDLAFEWTGSKSTGDETRRGRSKP